jgi:hypothetical protein
VEIVESEMERTSITENPFTQLPHPIKGLDLDVPVTVEPEIVIIPTRDVASESALPVPIPHPHMAVVSTVLFSISRRSIFEWAVPEPIPVPPFTATLDKFVIESKWHRPPALVPIATDVSPL